MNKFFKRLALLLAVLMIVSMMPVHLFADNSVTGEGQSNGTGEVKSAIVVRYFMGESSVDMEYDSNIASAVSEIVDNMAQYAYKGVTAITVTLNEDVTATSTLTFANDVTFDLNGHTLTVATNGDGIVVNNAALTLTNSGTTGKYVFDCSVRGSDGIFVNNTEDGKISTLNINSDVEIHANSNVNSAVHALAKKGEAIVNINAGKIVATGSGKQFHAIHADQNSTVNINDGEFDLNVDFTSYSENNDVVGIAIYGADNKQENITVNINGGTFKVGGKNAFAQVVQVGMSNGYSKNCTVNISGGEVILNPTENGTGYVYATYKTSYATAEISGGKVSGKVTALVNPYMTVAEIENDGLTISGGTFTTTSGTTLNVEKHLAEDATYDAETGTVKTNYVATVNGVGYATLADAIAAANGNGTVTLLTATTELVQALLDGQYGSIDGLTIELPAGDYGKLELGRATKYAGSNTEYFVGGFDSTDKNYKAFASADKIREYKGQSAWTPNCFYRRALKNVTIKAADGATVTIEKISADAGQIYGKANAPKYDYVLDVEIPDTNKSYYMALAWNNVTFEGINFKSSVNIESSSEKTLIDGLHFEKCNFNSGYTALAAANDANKASKGMGIRFVSWTETKNNLRNLTVNNCTFEDCYEGVYTNPVYGVSVTNSSFNNINHNAVAIQDVDSAVNHGNVVISYNRFENVGNRIIRFNNVGDGTTITITGNTSVNSGDSDGEIIKATTMPDSVNVNMTSNTWGDVNGKTAVLGNGFKPTSATIDASKYETLDDAIKEAKDGDVIVVSAGEYKLNGKLKYTGKAFTIKAADGAKVSFDMSAAVALSGAKITFEGVTFDYKTNGNYIGIQHADTLVYNNCTINGQVFLYATNETFNGCTFIQTSASAYNVWTYGAKNVKFNGCVFNCVGRCVLVYNEGAVSKTELEVVDTDFIASKPASGKAAIEIDTRFMADGATITVDGKTKADRFDKGSHSGNTLWNDKKQTADTNQNTTVVVDGKTVFEPANFIDLDLFIKWLANNGYNVDGANYISNINAVVDGKLTVKWSPVSGCFDEHHALGADCPKTAATGNTPKRLNSGLLQFQLFEGLNTAVIIKNVKFVYEPADVKICVNSRWKGSYTAADAPAGQLYFMTTGDVTVDSCDFEKVVFTTFNTTGTSIVNGCTFKDVYNSYAIKDIRGEKVSVTGTTIENCGGGIMVSSTGTVSNVTITRNTFNNVDTAGTAPEGKVGTRAILQIASSGDYASTAFDFSDNTATSCGPVIRQLNATVAPVGSSLKYLTESPNSASGLYTSDSKGSKKNPYTLEELGKMTRDQYIAAQEALGGTMYVEIGDYSYDKNGVLGNGVRNDTPGQTEDRSVLNGYNSNGYLGEENDGANGKKIIFVGGSITSGVTGYTSIDNIGTSLLLAVPAYTNVTFEGVTFKNVISFDYQLYTSPWSQLGELKFSGCTFNGIIVGAIAAQTLTFNKCIFTDYTNKDSANNSNPTWIRPAYGNWTQGDNEGQGSDFRSLTTINFTGNKVTSTRPVKFEYISQWDITSTVTATGNYFDITKQSGDTSIKNVGLYLGAHTDANEFHLVAADNTKSKNTAALYTIPSGKTSLPVDSTVKNTAGESIELTDALKWKATDAEKDKIVLKTVIAVASIGERRFATLEEAVAAVAKNGEEVTIKLLSNITAGGIDVAAGQNIVFDFDGHTYTLDGSMVGSTGTKTNGFRFLKGSTVVLKNGTLANGNGSPAKAMINSYATLKLVDFSVDARTTAVAETGSAYGYAALYISNGVTTVTGNGNYTTSDDNFVILIANVGDYTDGASLVFDENYTGTVSGKVSTGNKQNATVEIKNGKFDLKSIDVENTNTTVTISGGKFKNIEIAGKYLDNKAFDTEADADGYYDVMAHPIESFGVTVGEGLSLRLYVRDEYRNGKLLIKYVKPNGRDGETIEKELKINSVIENVNGTATIRYCARIFNITPQMADVVIKVQYVDETGVAIGSEKEVSILKYCQNYVKEDSPESVKIFISKLLEYCATAMDYRIVTNADEVYSGNTWQKRAEMLRKEKVSICGEANKEYKFENLGTYTNIGETFTTRGMEYDSVIKIFFAIDASKYNSNYKYYLNGNEISPIHYTKDDKDQYRFYFTIAPYEYHNSIRITIKNGEDDIGEYACSLDIILESFSKKSGNAELDALARLSVAAYEYCRSLADYPTSKDFNQ